jgi:hypothetical protein
MMLSYSFAGGAGLRLLDHRHAARFFTLVGSNRAYLRRWLAEWDVPKTADECEATINSQTPSILKRRPAAPSSGL